MKEILTFKKILKTLTEVRFRECAKISDRMLR